MERLNQEIIHEIEERTHEFALIIRKTSQLDDYYINKFLLVAVYANWEAFIKNSIKFYVNYLHSHDFLKDPYYISLIIKHEKLFNRNMTDQNQIKVILDEISHIQTNPKLDLDKIKFKIMNFDNTNDLLREFNLPEFNKENRVHLNTLVKHRNWIVHGKQEICLNEITIENIREYINLIEEMMNEFLLNLNKMI